MKKNFKALLTVIAILAMLSVFALTSFGATEYLEYVDPDGNVYTYYIGLSSKTAIINKVELKNDNTNLIVPDEIDGIPVTRLNSDIFYNAKTKSHLKLSSITIPDTVNSMGSPFSYCQNLKSIVFGNVTDCEINSSAFNGCSGLESVTFGTTKNVIIHKQAFMNKKNLKTVDFGNPTNMQIKNECFKGSGLTEVTVPKGVLLGQYVFSECPNLVKAEIYASPLKQVEKRINTQTGKVVSEKDVFSEYLFYKCPSLREATVSNYEIIYDYMFSECPALRTVNVGNATQLKYRAFYGCTSLKDFDCNGKTNIGERSFEGCTGLESFDFSKASKLSSSSFLNCTSLKSVDLSGIDIVPSGCFSGCTALTELNLSNVSQIRVEAFSGCTGLSELHIYEKIKICQSAFKDCTGLEKIFIEDGVEYIDLIDTSIGYGYSYDIFEGCTNVQYIYIGSSFLPKVKEHIKYTNAGSSKVYEKDVIYLASDFFGFYNLGGLEKIEVSPNNPYYRSVDDVLYVDEGDVYILLCYPQAKEGTYYSTEKALSGITKDFSLGGYAFCFNQNLKEVHFTKPIIYPEFMDNKKDLRSVSYELLSGSFTFSGIEKVTFPEGGLKTVGDLMFRHSAIKDIDLSGTERIKRYAFEECQNLTELNLLSCTLLENGVFEECHSLKTVNLPLWTAGTDDWEEIIWIYDDCDYYSMFANCTALESVNMPLAKRIPDRCFYRCTSLVNVNAPDCIKLEESCFYGCTSLEKLDMTVKWVGSYACKGCSKLKSIRFNAANIYEEAFSGCASLDNIDGVRSVGKSAFLGCVSLKNIKFQEVSNIRDSAFKDCSSLALLQFDSMNCSFGKNVFEGCPNVSFYCDENSTAYTYAVNNNIPVVAVSVSFQNSKYEYTGKEIEPSIIVSIGEMALVQNKDYTLSFENNKEVGGATVIVHFIGDFEGLPDAYRGFSIVRRSISSANIEYVKDNVYDGEDIRPAVVISLDGKTLTENVDYVIEYKNGSDIGTMLFTVKGIGNYTGTVDCYYNIVRRDIAETSVEKLPDCIYTGDEICPVPVIKWNGFTLVPDEDFEVRYFENVNAGFGTAVIYGKGNFCGTQKVTFRIFGKDIQNSVITEIPDQTYTGGEIRPDFTVTLNGITLTEGTDYTAEYINNTEKGTAEIIISGTGNYSGVIRKTFNIRKNSVYGFTVFSETQMTETYDGTPLRPEMEIYFGTDLLTEGKDYEIRLENNISAGTATVTVIGIGLFEGERTYNFTILPCEISEKDISVSGSLEYNGAPVEPQITVTKDGKTLQYGKDYIVTYSDNTDVGTAFVTVEGVGNYFGSVNLEYEIYKNEDEEPEIPDTPDKPEQNDPSNDNTDKTDNGNANNGAENGEKKPEKPSADATTPSKDNGSQTPQIPNTDANSDCAALFAVFALMLAASLFIRKYEEE